MQSTEIRGAFLSYFERKGHTIVPSSSLVPDDPTLLLTNAGMVQFKNVFLGAETRPYGRAASVQKCARLSGKHNDLEEVGPSSRHHTFFEMLGNFSFGDYFKREAVHYAWEFLTGVLKVPPERLWPTVYRDDDEAARLWEEIAGAPQERIGRLGPDENWWSMGDVGPNGPCSELFYDRGIEHCSCSLKGKCTPVTASEREECDRFWETWNLVFLQYNTDQNGKTTPLENPSIDTGLGLERTAAILQGARTNYDTDLFLPLMRCIQRMADHDDTAMNENCVPYRVIADHARSMTFLIADGVLPGNEERSYILRMLIRRAIRFGKQLGFEGPFLGEVADAVVQEMGGFYTELEERRDFILRAIRQEEKRFERTYETGMEWIQELIRAKERRGERTISGEEAFFLHDTHGFHLQITEDIAAERGLAVDREGFQQEMKKQRERSRKPTASPQESIDLEDAVSGNVELGPTEFKGYDKFEVETRLENVLSFNLDGDKPVSIDETGSELQAGDEAIFRFPQTPFYAKGGGQVADTGGIVNQSRAGTAQVLNVQRLSQDAILHQIKVTHGTFRARDQCHLKIDVERRRRTQRNHTATHILHAALRHVLDRRGGIQAGSLVAPKELRFDFTHLEPLNEEQIEGIEDLANEIILDDLPVQITYEPLDEAKAKGAMALFPEDYQGKEVVRVVSIVSEEGNGAPFSIELCGGTHVQRTGEIGLLKITREEGVSAGVRRLYVATGTNLLEHLGEKDRRLRELANKLKATEGDLPHRIDTLLQERDKLEQELNEFRHERLRRTRDGLLHRSERVAGADVIAARVDLENEELKRLSDLLEEAVDRGVVLLASGLDDKAVLVCKVSEALTEHVQAGEIVREAAVQIGGEGGGNPRFAQGGGPQPERLDQAFEEAKRSIREKLRA